MAFDPTLPLNNSPIVSAELRGQFTGLKALIDALPASQAMTDAINSQTAGNTGGMSSLNLPISNPPTQAQVEAIQDHLNALIDLLNRA
jgi:hypothetical protein